MRNTQQPTNANTKGGVPVKKAVSIRVEAKAEPNLRKLARALIALASQRLDEKQPNDKPAGEHGAAP